MGKAAGVMAMMFMAGGGILTVLSAIGGAWTEAIALALVGGGMIAASPLFGAQKPEPVKDAPAQIEQPMADPR